MSVILFAHSLTSVTSLDPSLQHLCLPVSLVYLSVVPSFTNFPDCLPHPCLPSSPPPLFCVCYSVFPGGERVLVGICVPLGGGTHFTSDMCFPGGGTHFTRHMCFPCGGTRAQNNGRSTDNVRPDCGLDRSNSGLAGHFDRSFLDSNIFNIIFSI